MMRSAALARAGGARPASAAAAKAAWSAERRVRMGRGMEVSPDVIAAARRPPGPPSLLIMASRRGAPLIRSSGRHAKAIDFGVDQVEPQPGRIRQVEQSVDRLRRVD